MSDTSLHTFEYMYLVSVLPDTCICFKCSKYSSNTREIHVSCIHVGATSDPLWFTSDTSWYVANTLLIHVLHAVVALLKQPLRVSVCIQSRIYISCPEIEDAELQGTGYIVLQSIRCVLATYWQRIGGHAPSGFESHQIHVFARVSQSITHMSAVSRRLSWIRVLQCIQACIDVVSQPNTSGMHLGEYCSVSRCITSYSVEIV